MFRLCFDELKQIDLALFVEKTRDVVRHADESVLVVDAEIRVRHAGQFHLAVEDIRGRDWPLVVVEEVLLEELAQQTMQVVLKQCVVKVLSIKQSTQESVRNTENMPRWILFVANLFIRNRLEYLWRVSGVDEAWRHHCHRPSMLSRPSSGLE